jgi:hypothetical protein
MSRKVTVNIRASRGSRGKRRLDPGAGPQEPRAEAPERVPRVARVLALAHHWRGLIRSGAVRDQADLARLVGVSRARVTQVMNLLWLAPGIQEDVLDGKVDGPGADLALHAMAREPVWADQRQGSSAARRSRLTCQPRGG